MSFIASAQTELYTVSDPDGYVNIRSGPSSKTSIVDRVVPGEIIWIFPEEEAPGWFPVYFLADSFAVKPGMNVLGNQVEASGYIHKSRLEPLSLQEVEFVTTSTDSSTTYSSDTVTLFITITANVDSSEGDAPFFLWGTDGGKPNKAYASISLELGDREIEFSQSMLDELYQPNHWKAQLFYDAVTSAYLLYMFNSDGAGSYEVVWQILSDGEIRRYAFRPY